MFVKKKKNDISDGRETLQISEEFATKMCKKDFLAT